MKKILLTMLLALVGAAPARGDGEFDGPPNILVIVSDDQGSFDMGFQGSRIRTPNIDRLAEEGARLRRFYVHPYCMPTRAALMTGAKLGQWAFGSPQNFGLPAGKPTVAWRFRDAGYQTALIGKWHIGTKPESHPNAAGFEHFYGLLGGFVDYLTHTHNDQLDWQRNGTPVEEEGYSTALLADEAVDFIEGRDENRPFFVVLAFNAVHGAGNMATPEMVARSCQGSTLPYTCRYWAAVEEMDAGIGRVLAALEEGDLDEDTLVVFFTDNGGFPQLRSFNTPPLRGGKFDVLEGGVRVGALMRWPGKIKPGDISRPVHVQDLWATFEAAAKLPREAPAGSIDHWRAIRSKPYNRGHPDPQQPLFFTNRPHPCLGCCCFLPFMPYWDRQSAIIDGRWKLVLRERVVAHFVVGEWLLPDWHVELYDVESDPGEAVDLSGQMPHKTDELLEELWAWEGRHR